MKQCLDLMPLICFFVFYKSCDIYIASLALIVATMLKLLFTWLRYRTIEKMSLINSLVVLLFGSLTYFFHNDLFIKWKVTAIYAFFSLALLFNQLVLKKPLLQRMLSREITLSDKKWRTLNIAWSTFLMMCSLANLYIALCLPQSTWVYFKVFGLTTLMLVFMVISGIYIYWHIPANRKK